MCLTDLKGQVKHDKTCMEMTLQVSCPAPGSNTQTPHVHYLQQVTLTAVSRGLVPHKNITTSLNPVTSLYSAQHHGFKLDKPGHHPQQNMLQACRSHLKLLKFIVEYSKAKEDGRVASM